MSATLPTTKKGYFSQAAIFMLFLGFSAGVPILLIFSSLGLWLREAGIDRATVTMFGWAGLGYSFKFIWAPLIDSLPVPALSAWLGRRRAWLLIAQLGVIFAICLMAFTNPANEPLLSFMAFGAVLLGFSSATQDIVIDAYRIESASTDMQPVLSAMYTSGYRLGMIVAGAGALYLAEFFGSTMESYAYSAWKNTYLIMAGVMGVGLVTTLTMPEIGIKTDETGENLRQKNTHLMKLYALIALVPTGIFGVWYLINKLFTDLFNITSFAIPSVISTGAVWYMGIMALGLPVAILFLLTRQPKITHLDITHTKETGNKNYLPLVGTFILSVIGLILAFKAVGGVLPESDSPAGGFVLEGIRLMIAVTAAGVVATTLTKIGFVKKEVVMATWVTPILDFFQRYGKKAALLLALIGLYRVSDIVAGVISNIFYQDMGFSKTDIANAVKLVGVIMTIGGGFLGGFLALRMPIMRAMMVGAILACATNLLFILLTQHQGELGFLYLAVILDNLAAGFASAVFIAFLSALTSIRFTAVQYALFSSLMTLFPKVLGGYSGSIVEAYNYPIFFTLTFAIGLPILYLIYLADKHIDLSDKAVEFKD
ncbi:MAG: MFS transporter [Moraxella sp.]|nr:MFS transporter [Moraxella sp.]